MQQALAAIEKKKQQQAQIAAWAAELVAGSCPPPIREQLYKILFKPDKNAPEYKAVVEASRAAQLAPLDLLKNAGAIDSPYQFHWKRFLFENFPKGTAFPPLSAPGDQGRAAAGRRAGLLHRRLRHHRDRRRAVGAGPGHGHRDRGHPHRRAGPGRAAGQRRSTRWRAQRLSTVYMPGYKITMLPDEVVQAYTLMEGRDCPAVSLYVTFDEATLAVKDSQTKLERVPIVANLRHDQLDAAVTRGMARGPRF